MPGKITAFLRAASHTAKRRRKSTRKTVELSRGPHHGQRVDTREGVASYRVPFVIESNAATGPVFGAAVYRPVFFADGEPVVNADGEEIWLTDAPDPPTVTPADV